MKPRFETAPWCDEDERVWWMVIERIGNKRPDGLCNLCYASELQDKRDADLMFGIEYCRAWERLHPGCFGKYAGEGWVHALVNVALVHPVYLIGGNITYCA